MNKLPTKQIYLMALIVVGIIALSVYSTYAIFTLETSTSDIVSIHTPNSLAIPQETYEYKQVNVPKNSFINTDVDIYNNFEYELCYSIWYKTITNSSVDSSKVKIYENTNRSLETTGTISAYTGRRINLVITNDNDSDVKVNIGLSFSRKGKTCELYLSKDKLTISNTIDGNKSLSSLILKPETKNNDSSYLTYKNQTTKISLPNDSKIYVSSNFNYQNEVFTLNNPKEISSREIIDYISNEETNYYTCINDTTCNNLYRIINTNEEINEDKKNYNLTNYDLFVGYLAGESGLKKITENNLNNYIYYGDNPNNFIYYNCSNELDTNTCELWRIVGIYYNQNEGKYLTKIIRNDSIGLYKYGNSYLWNDSWINNYLNKEYKLSNPNYIQEVSIKQENIPDLKIKPTEINLLNDNSKLKVTIINLSDYIKASTCTDKFISEYNIECLNNNWLNKNLSTYEWTMTAKFTSSNTNEETEETTDSLNNIVYSVSNKINESNTTESLNIRPVIYLKSRVILAGGNGTIDNPYIIR